MRGMKGNSLALMLLLALLVVGKWEVKVSWAVTPSECKEERRLGTNACRPVVFGREPSPECCQRVRVTHIECVCPFVSPKLAALINADLNRIVRKIKDCGRTLPSHFKCGSITIP
ncbi:hypothetical protein HHK36_028604 [Tetracentron sinense]|uniref:Bifunctional inhibitor/plant lipid transfer protein/seed storage helical domain-containing protein n=1 Tax=Tetracentron sinense TaxID=13715 RepID=A0A834YFC2_TETSI|nr:hypothetical protein HHK36_028604 [Tetracentron sinense]